MAEPQSDLRLNGPESGTGQREEIPPQATSEVLARHLAEYDQGRKAEAELDGLLVEQHGQLAEQLSQLIARTRELETQLSEAQHTTSEAQRATEALVTNMNTGQQERKERISRKQRALDYGRSVLSELGRNARRSMSSIAVLLVAVAAVTGALLLGFTTGPIAL